MYSYICVSEAALQGELVGIVPPLFKLWPFPLPHPYIIFIISKHCKNVL